MTTSKRRSSGGASLELIGRARVPPLPHRLAVLSVVAAALLGAAPAFAHTEPQAQHAHVARVAGVDRQFVLAAGEVIPEAPPAAVDPEVAAMADAVKGLIGAGKAGKWLLLVMFALKLVIYLLRLLAKKLPPNAFTNALTSRWGGWALNLIGSQLGAFGAAAATGTLTADTALALVFAGITTSLAAAGTRELVNDVKPAQAAGAARGEPGAHAGRLIFSAVDKAERSQRPHPRSSHGSESEDAHDRPSRDDRHHQERNHRAGAGDSAAGLRRQRR
jgi:hypothetical protein